MPVAASAPQQAAAPSRLLLNSLFKLLLQGTGNYFTSSSLLAYLQ